MQTECNPGLFGFAPVGRSEGVGSFDRGSITSAAGALLPRQAARMIGLNGRLAACFHDHRSQELIEHSVETLVGQRMFGNALGYEDQPCAWLYAFRSAGARRCRPHRGSNIRTVDRQPRGDS
jgi:hypothetical protein